MVPTLRRGAHLGRHAVLADMRIALSAALTRRCAGSAVRHNAARGQGQLTLTGTPDWRRAQLRCAAATRQGRGKRGDAARLNTAFQQSHTTDCCGATRGTPVWELAVPGRTPRSPREAHRLGSFRRARGWSHAPRFGGRFTSRPPALAVLRGGGFSPDSVARIRCWPNTTTVRRPYGVAPHSNQWRAR